MNRERIVLFDEYCKTCKYFKLHSDEEPCNECLGEFVRIDSRRPLNYKKHTDATKNNKNKNKKKVGK